MSIMTPTPVKTLKLHVETGGEYNEQFMKNYIAALLYNARESGLFWPTFMGKKLNFQITLD